MTAGMSGRARLFFALGAIFALLAVGAGAFGAHGLKPRLTTELLAVFETAARYQMYHALALFVVAWATTVRPASSSTLAGWFFVAGIALFSGSLYALSLTGVRALGAITPFGGLCFLSGWGLLAGWALHRSARR